MAKNILIGVLLLAVLCGGVYALISGSDDKQSSNSSSQSDSADMSNMDMQDTTEQSQVPSTTNQSTASTVEIKDYSYAPGTITVKKGTTVTWTNQDAVRHDVTPDTATDEFKKSELLSKGESFSVTFNTTGTFSYYCSPHPYMKGTVTVTE